MKNLDSTKLTQQELASVIKEEVQKTSKREASKSTFNFDASDLESYLMVRVWEKVGFNEKYQTRIGIRIFIKRFVVNFLKSPNNVHTSVNPFSAMSSNDDEGNESDFESTFFDHDQINIADDSTTSILSNNFVNSLTDRQRNILDLRVEGYDNNEISSMTGVHRNTVRNTLNTIKELALDFGLEG